MALQIKAQFNKYSNPCGIAKEEKEVWIAKWNIRNIWWKADRVHIYIENRYEIHWKIFRISYVVTFCSDIVSFKAILFIKIPKAPVWSMQNFLKNKYLYYISSELTNAKLFLEIFKELRFNFSCKILLQLHHF